MMKHMLISPELKAMNVIKSSAYDYTKSLIHLMRDDLEI